MLLLMIACAGKDDDANDPSNDDTGQDTTTSPDLSPADGAVDVPIDTMVTATLPGGAKDMDLMLSAGGQSVDGATSVDGETATFSPDRSLVLGTQYTAEIGDLAWTFTTSMGSFGDSEQVGSSSKGHAFFPAVAMDDGGNGMAVWQQSDGSNNGLWAAPFEVDGGWGSPVQLDTQDHDAANPLVGVDDEGNAVAAWRQSDGDNIRVWVAHFSDGSWDSSSAISSSDGDAKGARLSVGSDGDAALLWTLDTGKTEQNWAAQAPAGEGWDTPTQVDDGAGEASYGQIAVGSDATFAVWPQESEGVNRLAANQSSKGSWGTPVWIDDAGSAGSYNPVVAADGLGNAFVAWKQSDGKSFNVVANHYSPAGGWQGTQVLDTGDEDGDSVSIAVDEHGGALATWRQSDGGVWRVWAAAFDATNGWGTPTILNPGAKVDAYGTQAAFDASRNAMVVWSQEYTAIKSNRWIEGTWIGEAVVSEPGFDLDSPRVAMDAHGRAVVMWNQTDDTFYSVWAADLK